MCGLSTWDKSNFGQFQGSNQAPATVPVISSVTTSDGRTVSYNYTPLNDPTVPYVYQTLSSVNYDDGTQASYAYSQVLPSTRPLITSFVDPRYSLPFKKSRTSYFAGIACTLGEIYQQSNYDTGEVVYTLGVGSSIHVPIVTRGGGALVSYSENASTGQNKQRTDSLGRMTEPWYSSTSGFETALTDARGYAISSSKSPFDNPLSIVSGTPSAIRRRCQRGHQF